LTYTDTLIEQAWLLVRHDRKRPRQANLRRAVSAAYYAVFHMLSTEIALLLAPGMGRAQLRARAGRILEHGELKNVCKQSEGIVQKLLDRPSSDELRRFADATFNLQEWRHSSDYDLSETWSRSRAADAIRLAEFAIADWEVIKRSPEGRAFLMALVARRGLTR
jgi:uncharacterized protein (UPF0332 family)